MDITIKRVAVGGKKQGNPVKKGRYHRKRVPTHSGKLGNEKKANLKKGNHLARKKEGGGRKTHYPKEGKNPGASCGIKKQ